MTPVTRLVTFVDVDVPRRMSVFARREAVLVGGGRVLFLDDRGWSTSGPPNIWALTSVEDIVDTARLVVGPDEPFGGRAHEDMDADHWVQLAEVLREQGVVADALERNRLRHEVVLSERLLARRPCLGTPRRPAMTLPTAWLTRRPNLIDGLDDPE